jgi:hypothetical protein
MVSDELMKHILGNLSAEGIDRQRKHEYRQGYLVQRNDPSTGRC